MDAGALKALRATAVAAHGATTVDEHCQAAVGHLAALLDVPRCSILLVDGDRFHHAAAVGLDPEYVGRIDGMRITPELGSCGTAICTGRTVVSEDLASDPKWLPVREVLLARGLRACWSVPLRAGCDAPLGSLGIYHDVPGRPSPDQLARAETLADVLALGIDAIQRQQALSAGNAATIRALMSALDARDAYTGGHSAETAELAVAVAGRLRLDAAQRAIVRRAAELHDIGKIAIPDAVLRSCDPLDAEQEAVMRTHPVVGERIIGHVPGLGEVATAVRHEHERWDGGGYPDGLAADAIPVASRIVLACDAWHAMTSDRPYRPRLPEDEAVGELRRCAGTQFDPRVVDALLDVVSA